MYTSNCKSYVQLIEYQAELMVEVQKACVQQQVHQYSQHSHFQLVFILCFRRATPLGVLPALLFTEVTSFDGENVLRQEA